MVFGKKNISFYVWKKENYLDVMAVWKEGIDGSGVTVCVIDDGVDFEHPAIKDSFVMEIKFFTYY